MNHTLIKLILLVGLALTGCVKKTEQAKGKNSSWAQEQPYVVMLSIDGFRHDYAEKFGAKNLLEMASTGASADVLIPSFPSKTFPNHYTLVTGLRPADHGIVGNSFYSRKLGRKYEIRSKKEVTDGQWYGGTPIWVLAEKNHMLTASYYWAGSEADIQGILPTYFESYDHDKDNDARIDKVIEWLELPAEGRPHFVTLYFALVDDAGHDFGPDSNEAREAILEADRLIGVLRDRLGKLGLPIYFIVTSDHGMTGVSKGIHLGKIDFGEAVTDFSSTMLMVYSDEINLIESIRDQLEYYEELTILTKQEASQQLGFSNEDRVGDLVVLCEPPYIIQKEESPVSGGTHGYDPIKFQDMGAIFYIEGPKINPGVRLAPFDNVYIYPFLADLLGLKIENVIDSSQNIGLKLLSH